MEINQKMLQNGFDYTLLLNKKNYINALSSSKVGRKSMVTKGVPVTPEIQEIFDEGLNLYKKNRNTSFQLVYDKLCYQYFSKVENGVFEVLPQDERPTYRQFYYYCTKHLSKRYARNQDIKSRIQKQQSFVVEWFGLQCHGSW